MKPPRKLDIEVFRGKVVAVWLGCLKIPFEVIEVDYHRAKDMDESYERTPEEDGYHAITECQRRLLSEPEDLPKIIDNDISAREV